MKKLISILVATLMLLLCVGCDTENDRNNSSRSLPSYSSPSHSIPSSVPSYDFDFDDDYESSDEEDEYNSVTVYVSKTGKIHRIRNCSGMKYYTEMDYDEAVNRGYDFCQNCY